MNAALALGGWLFFRRGVGAPGTTTLLAWLVFAVNAWMPTLYLVASPVLGFGDWDTIVSVFPNRGPLRASLSATGLFIAGLLWKETRLSLARLVGNGARADRARRARRIVWLAWGWGGACSLVAAVLSPLSATWALAIAAGSTLGTTWPMLPAADRVADQPVPGRPLVVDRSWTVVVLGAVAAAGLIGILGPGITLGS